MIASFEGWWFRIRFGDDEPDEPAKNDLAVVDRCDRRQRDPVTMAHRAAGPAGSSDNWIASAVSLGDRLQGQLTGEDRGGGEVA